MSHLRPLTPSLALLLAASAAVASDGYFDLGYGVKAKGMGGAGVAFAQDSLAPATNPAGVAFIGNRLDGGVSYFRPVRSSRLGGTTYDGNETADFWIPELGLRRSLRDDLAVGLAIYGNGGMNTSYDRAIPAFGTSKAGIDLAQVFAAPTISWRFADTQAVGASLVLAYQRFQATGLENFGVANAGYDDSQGYGARLGYTGTFGWLSLGASWQSRTRMSRFDKYANLFAEHGDFDIPENYAVGAAITPMPGTTVALDVERILYSDIAAIGHDLTMTTMMAGLGSDGGPGFGWRDVNVVKLGIAQQVGDSLTLRAGYNHCTQPIQDSQTYFNMLAPGVVQDHLTLGATWRWSSAIEISAFYAHALERTVHGSASTMGPGTDANLTMSQDLAGVGVGWTH